mmetsp:Transcript_74022/g.130801  ORF Transcript_74022/g.130801 Transcript_74022/m.130801 type:complete len:244 (-) Transcript_74022:455-1186(-)
MQMDPCSSQAMLELLSSESTIPVAVHTCEGLIQLFKRFRAQLRSDYTKRHLHKPHILTTGSPQGFRSAPALKGIQRSRMALQPLVLHHLQCCRSRIWIPPQQLFKNFFPELRNTLPELLHIDVALAHLLQNFTREPGERRCSSEHHVQDHPQAPDISFAIITPLDDFWGHVVGCANLCGSHLSRLELFRKTEVCQLQIRDLRSSLRYEEPVLGLEVTVHNLHPMQVRYSPQHLAQQLSCGMLG